MTMTPIRLDALFARTALFSSLFAAPAFGKPLIPRSAHHDHRAIDGNRRGDKTPIYRLEPAEGH
jgi:hypothetical protein